MTTPDALRFAFPSSPTWIRTLRGTSSRMTSLRLGSSGTRRDGLTGGLAVSLFVAAVLVVEPVEEAQEETERPRRIQLEARCTTAPGEAVSYEGRGTPLQ